MLNHSWNSNSTCKKIIHRDIQAHKKPQSRHTKPKGTWEINQACSIRLTKSEELSYESTVEALTATNLDLLPLAVAPWGEITQTAFRRACDLPQSTYDLGTIKGLQLQQQAQLIMWVSEKPQEFARRSRFIAEKNGKIKTFLVISLDDSCGRTEAKS